MENKKCTDFEEDGYRCVPFYACKDGKIITNGASLITIRTIFDPLNLQSRGCDGLDICCRHPDWEGVPLKNKISIEEIPSECIAELWEK